MLAELVGWYTGRDENRRRYPRVKKDYTAEWSLGGRAWRPAYGVDISGGGMCLVAEREIPYVTVDIRMELGARTIELRALPVWHHETVHDGKHGYSYGLQYVSVRVGDWDAIMRWITGTPEGTKLASDAELAAIRMRDDEISRLIPAAFRKRLLDELVKTGRLAPSDAKVPSMVQFDYGGVGYVEGQPMHRLVLHSRTMTAGQETRFSTIFRFDDGGERLIVLE